MDPKPITTTVWYIDPQGDKRSNLMLSNSLPAENACEGLLCEDKVSRDLWRCPNWEYVRNFSRNADQNKMKYAIYNKTGDGPIRLWIFTIRPKSKTKKGGHHESTLRASVH